MHWTWLKVYVLITLHQIHMKRWNNHTDMLCRACSQTRADTISKNPWTINVLWSTLRSDTKQQVLHTHTRPTSTWFWFFQSLGHCPASPAWQSPAWQSAAWIITRQLYDLCYWTVPIESLWFASTPELPLPACTSATLQISKRSVICLRVLWNPKRAPRTHNVASMYTCTPTTSAVW